MRKIAIPILAPAMLMAMTIGAGADPPRSSVRQPDFSTCSTSREACLIGITRRGQGGAGCERAFKVCMRTGTWDTYGLYGRRVSGIDRR
jgi:hypothetical protein